METETDKSLVALADEIIKVLQEIRNQNDTNQKENAENGRMEFAYVEYYLTEVSSLLKLSTYLLEHGTFRKYTYFPARLIMEIVLQLEHVYSVKKRKGSIGIRRLFFKDIATSAKSSLELPGEGSKDKIRSYISFLDICSKILRLNFKTDNVSARSIRDIKLLCDKSRIVIKNCTGSELYNFYKILSEPLHANVVNMGASDYTHGGIAASNIFEISLELSIRFCEMIIHESKYKELEDNIKKVKDIAGLK